ncbi:hypothetical protein SLS62_008948 [Diatrype stigma]|uniref:Uncharacterized protein n=1 Tax=Diatrype stigma TaxID=117547 RepID=A0AAN9UIZ7_9PEZI
MALAATYKQFLAAPDASLLANDASLHYVTTTTTFKGPADIIKVIKGSNGQLKKNKEDVLYAVEGQNALAVEVDTALEFFTSGGPYLPGLDDNFLADRKVYLAVTHFVSFDGQGKISQIRQTWDQGSLLKQLDIIGKTGRNWPIRDSKEQIRMIESCVKSGPVAVPQEPTDVPVRPRTNTANTANTANISRDPHASLSLFGPREDSDHSIATVISPKAGVKPRQRDFAEIFGDEPVEDPDSPSAGRRAASPSKAVAPKAGAGKNFQPSRLFDTENEDKSSPDDTRTPVRGYKPHPTKYNHFDFADGSDPNDAPRPGDPTFRRTKHSSQWDFEDFATPAKPKAKNARQQDARHWGPGDNEVFDSPQQRKPVQGKARRDAEAHFELIDDGVATGEPRPSRPRGSNHNSGLGLYQNNLYNDEGEAGAAFPAEEGSRALGVITNQKDHNRNFQPHWNMEDQSPAPDPQAKSQAAAIGEDRKKAVKMMDANWSSYDVSPSQKENQNQNGHRSLPGQNGSFKENNHDAPKERGIHIGGDGMGGSRGSNRAWFFGEDGEEEHNKAKPVPGRKQPAGMKSGGFDWDF